MVRAQRQAPRQVGHASLQQRIREQIESEILAGIRVPGSAIDEKAVAASFNASRTPVREALITLSACGLVTIAPRSGIYVRKASIPELVCALEAICELEALVAGLAATRASPLHLEQMHQALEQCGQAAAQGDIDAYRQANARFHSAIHDAGANPVLAQYIQSARSLLLAYRYRSFEMPGRLIVSNQEHGQIVQAIANGDVSLAQSCMRTHISRGGQAMIALLGSAENA